MGLADSTCEAQHTVAKALIHNWEDGYDAESLGLCVDSMFLLARFTAQCDWPIDRYDLDVLTDLYVLTSFRSVGERRRAPPNFYKMFRQLYRENARIKSAVQRFKNDKSFLENVYKEPDRFDVLFSKLTKADLELQNAA